MTIDELKQLKESENKVEFKEARNNFSFTGGKHTDQRERKKCFLRYVVAFCNEGGGILVLGVSDKHPHNIVGSNFMKGEIGKLQNDTYSQIQIRITLEELYEGTNRVLIVHIPSRPIGKLMKYEGVPLMRTGDSLRNMSDEEMLRILQEQEPDFSATYCKDCKIEDLDSAAIEKMKIAFAQKQNNSLFLTASLEQALLDLNLIHNKKITIAALILLGKSEVIKKALPQAAINFEFRNSLGQINFDNRNWICEPYFNAIDILWELINLRNGNVPVQQGPYIFDIPFFNKEVIREALNNAVAHRNYRLSSEIVIKQFPNELHILNPGGFPLGVTLDNLLTISSTPRNRLLADVLAKTGVVERSGQGIDKIFYQSISDAKPEPDYKRSDNFQVELRLSGLVEDKAFALFIKSIQSSRNSDEKLSLQEIITLNKIRKEERKENLDESIVRKLNNEGLIEKVGKTNAQRLILSREYYSFTGKTAEYSSQVPLERYQIEMLITEYLEKFKKAKMKDFTTLLSKFMIREQVKYLVSQLLKNELLERKGKGSGSYYIEGKKMKEGSEFAKRVIELGIEAMKKMGEIKSL